MRVKRGVASHKRHNKIRRATKGMTKSNRASIKRGKQATTRALVFAYRDRRNKKRTFRALWNARINHRMLRFHRTSAHHFGLSPAPGCWKKLGMGLLHLLPSFGHLDPDRAIAVDHLYGRNIPVRYGGDSQTPTRHIRAFLQLSLPCKRSGRNSRDVDSRVRSD